MMTCISFWFKPHKTGDGFGVKASARPTGSLGVSMPACNTSFPAPFDQVPLWGRDQALGGEVAPNKGSLL